MFHGNSPPRVGGSPPSLPTPRVLGGSSRNVSSRPQEGARLLALNDAPLVGGAHTPLPEDGGLPHAPPRFCFFKFFKFEFKKIQKKKNFHTPNFQILDLPLTIGHQFSLSCPITPMRYSFPDPQASWTNEQLSIFHCIPPSLQNVGFFKMQKSIQVL